jgi:cell division septation protein DedD
MRRFVPLMAVTLLGGCAAIPPAIGIASYALDGISLLASGKTVSDHVLSAAADQDCRLFRMAQNLEVCTDWGTQPQVAAQRPMRAHFDRDDGSERALQVAALMPTTPTRPVAEQGAPMVLPAELADVAQALPGVAKVDTMPHVATALVAAPKPVMAPPPVAAGKTVMTALVPSAPDPAPVQAALPPPKPDVGALVRSDDAQALRDAVRASNEGRYLMVLGSFKGPEMAGRLARLHAGAKVVKADVQGETYYRVVIEPQKGARIASKLTDKPWLMPAGKAQPVNIASTLR